MISNKKKKKLCKTEPLNRYVSYLFFLLAYPLFFKCCVHEVLSSVFFFPPLLLSPPRFVVFFSGRYSSTGIFFRSVVFSSSVYSSPYFTFDVWLFFLSYHRVPYVLSSPRLPVSLPATHLSANSLVIPKLLSILFNVHERHIYLSSKIKKKHNEGISIHS